MILKSLRINEFLKKEKNKKLVYVILIIGVILLSLPSFLPQKEAEPSRETVVNERLEERLSNIISEISGVGKVKVMITYKSTSEKRVAKDKNTRNSANEIYEEEKNVLLGSGSEQKPFITREEMPKIWGVAVVAEGGGRDDVKAEISRAVRALTGVSANNIAVFSR